MLCSIPFLLLLFFAVSSVCCECDTQSPYSGSEKDCYCWAEGLANSMNEGGRVSWFPSGEFSTGGCTFCPASSTEFWLQPELNELEASLGTPLSSSLALEKDPESGKYVFWLSVGYCSGGCHQDSTGVEICNLFCCSEESCMNWCSNFAKSFHFSGQYQCMYVPGSEFSQEGCSVRGNIDPCGPFPTGC